MLRASAWTLFGLAFPLAAFCWWGMYTGAGRRNFDEMAGMIPFFAGVAAVAFLVSAAVLALLASRR